VRLYNIGEHNFIEQIANAPLELCQSIEMKLLTELIFFAKK